MTQMNHEEGIVAELLSDFLHRENSLVPPVLLSGPCGQISATRDPMKHQGAQVRFSVISLNHLTPGAQ